MLHDYLHCLVFKEQSYLALLSKHPSLQATHLSYRIQISLSRTFLKVFATKSWWVKSVRMQSHLDFVWGLIKNRKVFNLAFRSFSAFHSSLPIKTCWTVSLPCLSATCIILHESKSVVNSFLKKNKKKVKKAFAPQCLMDVFHFFLYNVTMCEWLLT